MCSEHGAPLSIQSLRRLTVLLMICKLSHILAVCLVTLGLCAVDAAIPPHSSAVLQDSRLAANTSIVSNMRPAALPGAAGPELTNVNSSAVPAAAALTQAPTPTNDHENATQLLQLPQKSGGRYCCCQCVICPCGTLCHWQCHGSYCRVGQRPRRKQLIWNTAGSSLL